MKENAKELFISDSRFSSEKHPLTEEEIRKVETAKERWGVLDGLEEKFEKTLSAHGYKFVRELENGIKYPSVTDWVEMRGIESKHIRFYPAFIQDTKTGNRFLCKVKIARKLDYNPGLQVEANILSALPLRISAPRLIKYVAENPKLGQLEILVIEEIRLSEATVLPREKWIPEYIPDVANQINLIEETPLSSMPSISQEPLKNIHSLFEHAGEQMTEAFALRAQTILRDKETDFTPVFVHADMWIKNILISTDPDKPKAMLVDWALAGAGYRGEDLARLWWDLWNNENLKTVVPKLNNGREDEKKVSRKNILRLGLLHIALRDIVERVEHIPNLVEPKLSQILLEIKKIQEQALVMLEYLEKN